MGWAVNQPLRCWVIHVQLVPLYYFSLLRFIPNCTLSFLPYQIIITIKPFIIIIKNRILDVIVVGAGHAGLCASYYLKNYGLEHLVFEREKIGESWRSQRWDSFRLNTLNRLNHLPEHADPALKPEEFATAKDLTASMENLVTKFRLPVKENSKVISIIKDDRSDQFSVSVSRDGQILEYQSRQVIIASGTMTETKIPKLAKSIPSYIKQYHTSEYKNSNQLPEGAVLVVGSAQSGIQIAEDLVDAGRKVFLATSKVARLPRRYRGKDIIDWMIQAKFFEMLKEDVQDPDDLPDTNSASSITKLNFKENNISTIIWSIGFNYNFSYLNLPIFDEKGYPRYGDGVSPDIEGLYFIGFPWQQSRRSSILFGIKMDAEVICGRVAEKATVVASETSEHLPIAIGRCSVGLRYSTSLR